VQVVGKKSALRRTALTRNQNDTGRKKILQKEEKPLALQIAWQGLFN
jgi:hypothetical protein